MSVAYNPHVSREPGSQPVERPPRLESWKEIAVYLNRSERTVRRWEAHEDLPVHRHHHDKRGSVYAYPSELDQWRESRQQLVAAAPEAALPHQPSAFAPSALRRDKSGRSLQRLAVPAVAIALVGVALVAFTLRRPASPPWSPRPDALRAYQLGAFAGNAGRAQIASGIRYYQEAIRLEPAYAEAWNSLAFAHIAQTFFGERPARETLSEASRAAKRAGELDPSLTLPRTAAAAISHYLDWDHGAAEEQFRASIARAPDVAVIHSWYAELSLDLRRFDAAAACARKAHEVDPRWLEPIVVAGNVHAFAGHVDLAIAEYQRALAIEPAFGLANHFLGRAYLAKGDHGRAVQQLRRSNELLGEVPFSIGDLGYALAVAGARDEAERMLAAVLGKRSEGFYPAFPIAQIYLGLGRHEEALDWIEHAATERQVGYYMPSVDPIYNPIRTHPRFRALLRRMNLDG
jgi:tetratricopeptide (TPR) repeat protein